MHATTDFAPNAPAPANLHLLLLVRIKREPSQPDLTGFVLYDCSQLPTRLVAGIRPDHHGLNLRRATWAKGSNRHDLGFVFVTKWQVQN
jgi:hypothetical protein